MLAYRFRLLYDEQEDFLRDYEVKPGNTFKDFHAVIIDSIGLEANELASFFICDPNWNKQREITLIDMGMTSADAMNDEDENVAAPMPISIMEDVKIREAIEDPHQRILFEYNFLNTKTFFIELTKIFESDPARQYPVCVRSEGVLTATVAQDYFSYLDDPDEEAMLGEVDKMISDGELEEEVDENFTTEPEW